MEPPERPVFTLWPWKIAALAVPAVAVLAAVIWWFTKSRNVEDLLAVFLACCAFGTTWLFAAATREFTRHVLAIPLAAGIGAGSVVLLSFQPALIVFLVLFAATFLSFLMNIIKTSATHHSMGALQEFKAKSDKVRVIGGSITGFVLICVLAFYKPGQMILAYPFTCGFIGMMFPGQSGIAGRLLSWEQGIKKCFQSLMIFLIVACALMVVVDQIWNWKRMPAYREPEKLTYLMLAVGIALIPSHFYFIRWIFELISTVEMGL